LGKSTLVWGASWHGRPAWRPAPVAQTTAGEPF